MGVNITFTFGHKLKNISMAEVSRQCDAMNDTFLEVARFWSHWYPHLGPPLEPWRDTGAHDEGQPFYGAPAGFSFRFGSSAVYLHHLCRFRIFTQDMPARTLLRRFTRQCCEILGGDRIIYSPDEDVGDKILDLVTDNYTIADIEAELLRLAPPAITFGELDNRWCPPWPKPAAYYVDTCQNISLPVTGTT